MTRCSIAVVILLFCASPVLAQGAPPAVDEERIYREIAELQDRAGTIDPGTRKKAVELLRRGVKAHDRHDYEEALGLYREVLEMDPTNPTAYYELALTLSSMGESLAALENVIRAIALDPTSEGAYVMKGSLEDDLGFPDRAIATYDRLLDVSPASYLGLLNKAITLMKLDRYAEAEALLERARQSNPSEPSSYLRLAQAARAQGFDYDEQKHLERFLELGAKDPRAAAARARLAELRSHAIELTVDAAYPDIELAVLTARALWRSTKHRELDPAARGYHLTFDEERSVLQELALGLWRKKKAEDPTAAHGYYDLLLKVDDAGYFEEYVYHQRQREIGQPARDWLDAHPDRVSAFLAWARAEGLTDDENHKKDELAAGETGSAATHETVVLEKRDLPAFVFAILDQSDLTYEIDSVKPETPDFFDSERRRWKGFRFTGEDRVDCDFDVRAAVEEVYADHLRPLRTWVRCFGPDDTEWGELKVAQRFGARYQDLAPRVQGAIAVEEGGKVRVRVPPGAGWMVYLLSKAAWPREDGIREAFEKGRGPDVSLSEEVFALTAAVAGYTNSLVPEPGEDPAKPDSYMEQLAAIDGSGLLRGFVAFELLHKRYGVSLRRLEPDLADQLDRYLTQFVFPLVPTGSTAGEQP